MPNKPAARKSLRQSRKHAEWNLARKEAYKGAIKKVTKSATAKEALKLITEAQKALGKAAKRGVLKKKTAARKLSRLMARVHKMK